MEKNLIGIKEYRNNGYIDLDYFLSNMGIDTSSIEKIISSEKVEPVNEKCSSEVFSFYYDGIKYYYKTNEMRKPFNYYAELLAEELLYDYGLPCAEYDLAICSNNIGVISKNFKKDNFTYVKLSSILTDCYGEENYFDNFHLDGIWYALECRYKDENVVSNLMNRIVNKFLFDILTNQLDSSNLFISEHGNDIDIAPMYDNELMLYSPNYFSFGVDEIVDNFGDGVTQSLEKFLGYGSSDYYDLIMNKVSIISEENLLRKFVNIERKTNYPIPEEIKKSFLNGFKKHREKIEKILRKHNESSYIHP